MALTDLRGTKWYLNETLNYEGSSTYSIDFICDSVTYNEIGIQNEAGVYLEFIMDSDGGYEYLLAYTVSMYDAPDNTGWRSDTYRTIEIVGGADTTNAYLISWLESNATLLRNYIVPESVLLDLADNLREHAGWSEDVKLSWPDGYINAINDISKITIFDKIGYIARTINTAKAPDAELLGNHAFHSCSMLTSIDFPGCVGISSNAFEWCSSLRTASFKACKSIGASAFRMCSNLTTVSFPTCEYIGTYAFESCSSLISVSFPACTYIGTSAFSACYSIKTAFFPECAYIPSSLFRYAAQLTTATFSACSYVGNSAFEKCYRLLSLYLLGSSVATLANTNAFSSTPISTYTQYASGVRGSIFVRQSLLTEWKASTNWIAYSERFVGLTDAQISELQM